MYFKHRYGIKYTFLLKNKTRINEHDNRKMLTYELYGGGFTGQRRSARKSQHSQSLNGMLEKSCEILGEEEVGGRIDEDFTALGGRNADTAGVSGAISCVPNICLCCQLNTELSGGMAPASPQAPSPYFDGRRIGTVIAFEGVGSPGRVKEIDCWFKE